MILQLRNITFGFLPERQILKDISLSLEEKQIYALMGSNGAGKTTLFNLICGFIKPQSGEIFLGGHKLTHQPPYKINQQGIGRIFQDLRLITKLTVKENIILAMPHNPSDGWLNAMLPEQFFRNANQKLSEEADKILEKFFLNGVGNSIAYDISYGQQKLLSLACCVANGATHLLLDEAVAGLQPEYRNKIAVLIKQLKEQGRTILLIEHNADFITEVADKIFFLHEGEITTFENMKMLRKDKKVMDAYV